MKICFFDSGIGGLSLLYECVRILPDEEFYYFADNFNVPYGNLTDEELLEKTDTFFRRISLLKPSAAVVACNTVTSRCVDYLRSNYSFPIIGIQPAIKPAAAVGTCTVLATPSTAASRSIAELSKRFGCGRTEIVPCRGLADYIEKNIFNLEMSEVKKLLPEIKSDGIVLGCTHYSFIKKFIKQIYPSVIYDGNLGTAEHLRTILGNCDHSAQNGPKIEFIGGDTAKNRAVFNNIKTFLE